MSRPSSIQFSGWTRPTSPYDVLGVSRSASNAEIRRAYKKRALETHPDKQYQFGATEEEGLAAEALFREVSEAFELLNDISRRRIYDIHSRPPPVPRSHRRTSTETSASSQPRTERRSSASSTDEPGDHPTRAHDRAEWVRQEQAAHQAWRAERTKSFSGVKAIPATPPPATSPSPVIVPADTFASTFATHMGKKAAPPSKTIPVPNTPIKPEGSVTAKDPTPTDIKPTRREPNPNTSAEEQAEKQQKRGSAYEELVDRILAELYVMAPEWLPVGKTGSQRMYTNPV